MSAVMSSWGNRPGTRPLTWIPYGPHSTASVSTMFFTPAFAAAVWAKPGPPVHAYDAPTLTIDPGVSASRWRRANSRAQKNVPFSVMSTTVRHAFGDMSSAGTGKFAAALLISTPGSPNADFGGVEGGRDLLGVADVAAHGGHRCAQRGDRFVTGLEVLGLAAGDDDRRAEAGELERDRLARGRCRRR